MAAHVMYEIDGFRKGFEEWKELSSQEASADSEAFNKAVALLHYRTLLEFFRSEPRQLTVDENISIDIVATDYLAGSTGNSISGEAERLCEAYKARIDQQLCHISTGRREGRIWREWPSGAMKEKMEALNAKVQREPSHGKSGLVFIADDRLRGIVFKRGKLRNG